MSKQREREQGREIEHTRLINQSPKNIWDYVKLPLHLCSSLFLHQNNASLKWKRRKEGGEEGAKKKIRRKGAPAIWRRLLIGISTNALMAVTQGETTSAVNREVSSYQNLEMEEKVW